MQLRCSESLGGTLCGNISILYNCAATSFVLKMHSGLLCNKVHTVQEERSVCKLFVLNSLGVIEVLVLLIAEVFYNSFVAFLPATIFFLILKGEDSLQNGGLLCKKHTESRLCVSGKSLCKAKEFGEPLAGRGT